MMYPILLVLSRLTPCFYLIDNTTDETEEEFEEVKESDKPTAESSEVLNGLIKEYLKVIQETNESPNYFIRKISSEAMLPFVEFSQFPAMIMESLSNLNLADSPNNTIHGYLFRALTFTKAWIKFRDQYRDPSHKVEDFTICEGKIRDVVNKFETGMLDITQSGKKRIAHISFDLVTKMKYILKEKDENEESTKL